MHPVKCPWKFVSLFGPESLRVFFFISRENPNILQIRLIRVTWDGPHLILLIHSSSASFQKQTRSLLYMCMHAYTRLHTIKKKKKSVDARTLKDLTQPYIYCTPMSQTENVKCSRISSREPWTRIMSCLFLQASVQGDAKILPSTYTRCRDLMGHECAKQSKEKH